ncbi:MAG: phosphatase PAP2 family protein [Bacteroidota bacterium]
MSFLSSKSILYSLLFVLFIWLIPQISAAQKEQSPYRLSYQADIPIVFTSLAFELGGISLTQKIMPLTEMDIADLDPMDINPFDRGVTGFFNESIADVSDWFLNTAPLYPVIFVLADNKMRKDFLVLGALTAETLFMTEALVRFSKGAFKRTRPLVYNPDVPYSPFKDGKGAKVSFFSGHTAMVSSMSFFSARLFADYHPDSKWRYVVWGLAAAVPATVAGMRVAAGKHFYTDVIAGYLIGGAVGYFIPTIHKKVAQKHRKKANVKLDTGLGLTRLSWEF